ncbi:MAG: sce7726 family protein [Actinomycetota bacterium]|nr:sce7726 family protein [Actinomycetota bacterium]
MREAEVRAALARQIAREHADDPRTRVVHELNLSQAAARIDLAVVNGQMIGWEIKSQADNLSRLPRQQEVYSRIFDRVWLALASRHLEAAINQVPPWWGIVVADGSSGECELRVVRRSRLNRKVDPASIVRLLWRQEVLDELDKLGLAEGLHRAPRRQLWNELAGAVPRRISGTQLRAIVRERLRHRPGWRSDELGT